MSSSYYRKKKHLFLKEQHLNDLEVETEIERKSPTESLSSTAYNNGNMESPRNDLPDSPSFHILDIEHTSPQLLSLSNVAITEKSLSSILTHKPSICNLDDSDLSRKSLTNSEIVKSSFSDKIHALLVRHISHVTKNFVTTELMEILREDGHIELPKSAATLLKSGNYQKENQTNEDTESP